MRTNHAKSKGIADLYIIIALGVATLMAIPNFREFSLFKPKPPTAQLVQAQAELERARAEAKAANEALEASRKADLAKKDAQIGYAQQMAVGAKESLKKATPEPSVLLAISLIERTNVGLAAAIGDLPADKQVEIVRIVSEALSGQSEAIASANRQLAEKDKALAVLSTERDSLKQQLPALQQKVELTAKDLAAKNEVVATTTAKVVAFADKLAAKEKEAGSLGALIGNLWRTVEIMGIFVLIGFGLYAYVRYRFGGIPKAIGASLGELRSSHPELAAIATDILDRNLNRDEQANIASHAP